MKRKTTIIINTDNIRLVTDQREKDSLKMLMGAVEPQTYDVPLYRVHQVSEFRQYKRVICTPMFEHPCFDKVVFYVNEESAFSQRMILMKDHEVIRHFTSKAEGGLLRILDPLFMSHEQREVSGTRADGSHVILPYIEATSTVVAFSKALIKRDTTQSTISGALAQVIIPKKIFNRLFEPEVYVMPSRYATALAPIKIPDYLNG